jgi:hypothetical protein
LKKQQIKQQIDAKVIRKDASITQYDAAKKDWETTQTLAENLKTYLAAKASDQDEGTYWEPEEEPVAASTEDPED